MMMTAMAIITNFLPKNVKLTTGMYIKGVKQKCTKVPNGQIIPAIPFQLFDLSNLHGRGTDFIFWKDDEPKSNWEMEK